MRIISGERRGLKLNSPNDLNTRPTSDRIKESIFNIMGYIDEDAVVLDGFSGTGSIGIEFLSRGAKFAYLCERDRNSAKIVAENIAKAKYEERTKLIQSDLIRNLKSFSDKGIVFDYIYLDPPYNSVDLYEKALSHIAQYSLLSPNGIIILERQADVEIENIKLFVTKDARRYGATEILFLSGEEA